MAIDVLPLEHFQPIPVIDGHFHMITRIKEEYLFKNLNNVMAACRTSAINVLSLSGRGEIEGNMSAALCKAMNPTQVYAFGGLHYHLPGLPDENINLEDQARKMAAIGFDGFKMIEGKPSVRQELGVPLDGSMHDGFFSFLQEKKLPLLFHVADPWQGSEPPPEIERVYKETQNILDKFPELHIIFAHFFFLSHKLDQAAELLDTYPNVNLDLTPHGGMYADFSNDPEKARQFFIQYQNRIVFGTDNHGEPRNFPAGSPLEYWPVHKLIAMRTFLETDKTFQGWHHDLTGLALPEEVLQNIYLFNFQRMAGRNPGPLHIDLAIEECERLIALARRYAIVHEVLPGVQLFVEKIRAQK
jgi:predicted TIM-barrel fold metal-dependent hydrolase